MLAVAAVAGVSVTSFGSVDVPETPSAS